MLEITMREMFIALIALFLGGLFVFGMSIHSKVITDYADGDTLILKEKDRVYPNVILFDNQFGKSTLEYYHAILYADSKTGMKEIISYPQRMGNVEMRIVSASIIALDTTLITEGVFVRYYEATNFATSEDVTAFEITVIPGAKVGRYELVIEIEVATDKAGKAIFGQSIATIFVLEEGEK